MKPRSNSVVLIGLILSTFCVAAVQAQTEAEVKAHYTKSEAQITMRDGVRHSTSIYLTKDKSRKYPNMLNRTPHSVSPYGGALLRSVL